VAERLVAGIDIGGTNTAIGLVDASGHCVASGNVATASFESPDLLVRAAWSEVERLLAQADSQASLAGVGIGAPNGNYYQGTIEHAPNLRWRGVIRLVDLFRKFTSAPVVLTNDANAAAIGEGMFGAAKGLTDYIVITLGTGVGSGIVVGGELLYGHDGFAGEIGHTIVDPEGRECGCGRRGCLETYTSAGGIKRTVFELLATRKTASVFRTRSFDDVSAHQIAEAARAGDEIAREAFELTGKVLGLKLADAIAHTSPQAIILFGGLAQAGELIFEPTKRWMDLYTLNIFSGKVKLLPSGLQNENVAVLGAAALVWQQLERSVA
jgi:glucokinase